MKRNMDLVRDILFAFEEFDHDGYKADLISKGYTDEEIGYHCAIMDEAGLVTAVRLATRATVKYSDVMTITWFGHDFIDAARSNTIWNKAKATIGDKLGTAAFDVIVGTLNKLAMGQLLSD